MEKRRSSVLEAKEKPKHVTKWGIKDYVNMQTKNLVSNRDASKIGKISVFNFSSDIGIKN